MFIVDRPSMPLRLASSYSSSRVGADRDEPPREDRDDPPEEPLLLEEDREDFVSPDWARCLFTVRAAISLARPVEAPRSWALSLM